MFDLNIMKIIWCNAKIERWRPGWGGNVVRHQNTVYVSVCVHVCVNSKRWKCWKWGLQILWCSQYSKRKSHFKVFHFRLFWNFDDVLYWLVGWITGYNIFTSGDGIVAQLIASAWLCLTQLGSRQFDLIVMYGHRKLSSTGVNVYGKWERHNLVLCIVSG